MVQLTDVTGKGMIMAGVPCKFLKVLLPTRHHSSVQLMVEYKECSCRGTTGSWYVFRGPDRSYVQLPSTISAGQRLTLRLQLLVNCQINE